MGFRSGDCDGHGKTFILRSVNHFCVDFEVCFGSLSCWKVQPRPILSLLEGAVRFSFNICWYLMESMIPCILTRCPGPLEEKQPHNIKDPPPYFTLGMGVFSVWLSFCLRQTHLWCLLPKSFILVSSDHITRSHWKSDLHLANCRRFSLLLIDSRGFFLATLQNNLWWCRWRLMVVLETFWPQDSTHLYNSPAVILGDSFASRTILLTVRGVNLQIGPLPGWFLTSPVALNFLIISMIVEMGIFNCLEIFLCPFLDLCSSTTFRRTSSLCSWVFPIVMND